MSVAETLLVYVAAPMLITGVLAALTLRPDAASRRRRYRPGQPWEHEPLWYAPHTGHAAPAGPGDRDAMTRTAETASGGTR